MGVARRGRAAVAPFATTELIAGSAAHQLTLHPKTQPFPSPLHQLGCVPTMNNKTFNGFAPCDAAHWQLLQGWWASFQGAIQPLLSRNPTMGAWVASCFVHEINVRTPPRARCSGSSRALPRCPLPHPPSAPSLTAGGLLQWATAAELPWLEQVHRQGARRVSHTLRSLPAVVCCHPFRLGARVCHSGKPRCARAPRCGCVARRGVSCKRPLGFRNGGGAVDAVPAGRCTAVSKQPIVYLPPWLSRWHGRLA